jgi:hypothetical protein
MIFVFRTAACNMLRFFNIDLYEKSFFRAIVDDGISDPSYGTGIRETQFFTYQPSYAGNYEYREMGRPDGGQYQGDESTNLRQFLL